MQNMVNIHLVHTSSIKVVGGKVGEGSTYKRIAHRSSLNKLEEMNWYIFGTVNLV